MLAVVYSLGAALTFALSALMVDRLKGRVGLFQFGRWQMGLAFGLTAATSIALGGWRGVDGWQFGLLTASSASGIMLASTTYFATIHVAGPRIAALLFTLASPFAVGLGYAFLGETVTAGQGGGIVLILAGIALAIAAPAEVSAPRRLWLGVALGTLTSLGQAAGSLLARPAMAAGVEPFTAMAIRSGAGALFFLALMAHPLGRADRPLDRAALRIVALSAFVGMYLGMSLLMAALARGDVGIVTTLSSTTPILILPMLWALSGRRPGLAAWVGAGLAVAGTAAISVGG